MAAMSDMTPGSLCTLASVLASTDTLRREREFIRNARAPRSSARDRESESERAGERGRGGGGREGTSMGLGYRF
jgi:hypothetical protein